MTYLEEKKLIIKNSKSSQETKDKIRSFYLDNGSDKEESFNKEETHLLLEVMEDFDMKSVSDISSAKYHGNGDYTFFNK